MTAHALFLNHHTDGDDSDYYQTEFKEFGNRQIIHKPHLLSEVTEPPNGNPYSII